MPNRNGATGWPRFTAEPSSNQRLALKRTWICSKIGRSSTTIRIAPSLLPRPIAYVEMVIRGMLWRKKVIDDYADRAAPTYPLILYYKIAYLGGGESDLSKLKRRQADMHLVDRALGQLFVTRQAELRSFITDPRGKECLNTGMLGSNSAPSWMQDLTKGITRVCQQVEAWEQLVEKRRNSPADSLTPTVSGKELLTALKKVEALYPFPSLTALLTSRGGSTMSG